MVKYPLHRNTPTITFIGIGLHLLHTRARSTIAQRQRRLHVCTPYKRAMLGSESITRNSARNQKESPDFRARLNRG